MVSKIIKQIFTFLLLPAAIAFLAYLNVETVAVDVRFKEKDKPGREAVAIQRLKDIRTLQEAYKNVKGYYAVTMDSLKLFYNEGNMKVVYQVGTMDDSLTRVTTDALVAKFKARGIKKQEALQLKLYEEYKKSNGTLPLAFAVDSLVPVKDTLFHGRTDFSVDSLKYIPFTKGRDTIIMRSEIREVSGVKVPLFEAMIPYKSLLKGLDEQLVINLIAEREDLELYPGLKVGDIEKPNNNAGNWE